MRPRHFRGSNKMLHCAAFNRLIRRSMIQYQITSNNPASHYFDVSIVIENPATGGQLLRLPNWIPGSYMIRDFARNLLNLRAHCGDQELALEQLDKSNWQVAGCNGALTVSYQVYARDLSVRSAHLDTSHGYYNGTSVFLEVIGQGDQPCEVRIDRPKAAYCSDWKVATSLPRKSAGEFQFGLYQAADHDELIDHPVEMGKFRQIRFEACGVPHDMILTGRFECDEARLQSDLTRICEQHIRFFGEPAPVDYYQFQVIVVGAGYGGLEHRASTSLLCSRESLPQPGQSELSDAYRDFLGLCSHEYFHTWNIKRIKPAAYQPYDLQQEVYTELLWAFEGITSYYDDLALLRCGLIDEKSYLELLSQTLTRVQRGLGSTRQSAGESSFNTWTKFYKQDENAQNAIVSYYAKGCLIALCLDLKLRALSDARVSLDDVMRALWQNYLATGKGVEDDSIQRLASELVGSDLSTFLQDMISTTNPLPLDELLATVGIALSRRGAINQQDKGGKAPKAKVPTVELGAFLQEQPAGLLIQRVNEAGSAQNAGLAAEDIIVAIDGLKLSLAQLEQKLLLASPGDAWRVHAFRRDELREYEVKLEATKLHTIDLATSDQQLPARAAWWASRA